MKKKKIFMYSVVLILVLVSLIFIAIWFDLNNLTSRRISTNIEIVHLDDLKDTYIESDSDFDLYHFDKNKIIFICFSLNNKSSYTLRNVKLKYYSFDYRFERIETNLHDGGEVIVNPNFNDQYSMPIVIHKNIDENAFLKSLKYEFDFMIFNKSFSVTN